MPPTHWRAQNVTISISICRISCVAGLVVAAIAGDIGGREASPNIRVRSDQVLIHALVTKGHKFAVAGLDLSRFRLFEDGNEQVIRYCAGDDGPVSMGLVLDTSGIMGEKLSALKKVAVQFVRATNSADECFLLQFRGRPEVLVPFTSKTDRLISAIDSIESGGSTALEDAIYLALWQIRRAKNPRKAILVISYGMDNHSCYSARETKRLALELDSPIYTINLWEPPRSGSRYALQRRDPGLLEAISVLTGGRSFAVRDPNKLAATVDLISSEIRHEYVLGYVPSNRQADGKFRHVRVKVESSGTQKFEISYRPGYFAPIQ